MCVWFTLTQVTMYKESYQEVTDMLQTFRGQSPFAPKSPSIPNFAPCLPGIYHYIYCVGAYDTRFSGIVRDEIWTETHNLCIAQAKPARA